MSGVSLICVVTPLTYRRWFAPDQPTACATPTGDRRPFDIPVAAYWAYSGAAPVRRACTAPLVYYKKRHALERKRWTGRIVVFEVKGPPASMAPRFRGRTMNL